MNTIPEHIQKMIDNQGIYLCGDSKAPESTVPVASIEGKLYSLALDAELDPLLFLDSLTIAGPFHKVNQVTL